MQHITMQSCFAVLYVNMHADRLLEVRILMMSRCRYETHATNSYSVIYIITINHDFITAFQERKFNLEEKRGLAILVTCHYRGTLPQTEEDADEIKRMFTQFDYDIHQLPSEQVTLSNIKQLVQQVETYLRSYNGAAINYPDGNKKAIIFAFSGHGADNQIQTNDGDLFPLHDIVRPLVNPQFVLADPIPKLFFIDACRGSLRLKDDTSLTAIKGNYCIEYATIQGQPAAALGPQSAWMPVLANTLRRDDTSYHNVIADVKQQVHMKGHQRAQSIDNLTGGQFKLYHYMPK